MALTSCLATLLYLSSQVAAVQLQQPIGLHEDPAEITVRYIT